MKRAIFTALLGVCAAMPALAAELEFSAGGDAEYDDNIFRTTSHKQDDGIFRLRPGVRVYEDRGDDLNFSVGYQAPVELFLDHSGLDEVDHVGDGRFDYHANERLTLFGTDHYGYLRSTMRIPEVETTSATLAEGTFAFNDQRDKVKINDATLGAIYSFSPRTSARVVADSSFFDSSRQDRAKVWSVGGTADMQYKLTLRHQLGAGAGYEYQKFDERLDIPGSDTQTYRLFGTWRWLITDKLLFDLNAGPAYLRTSQDKPSAVVQATHVPFAALDGVLFGAAFQNCGTVEGRFVTAACVINVPISTADENYARTAIPITNVNPGSRNDTTITGFAEAVLTQRWSPNLASALRYSRQQGDASGLGGTVIVDSASLSNTWDFMQGWQLAVRGDWVRRQSAFDIQRTFDEVQPSATVFFTPPGGAPIPIAERTGKSFSSRQNVDIDTATWGGALRITHQLFRTTSIYAQARYSRQDSKSSSLGAGSDFENFLATFGVAHVFEPIPLW